MRRELRSDETGMDEQNRNHLPSDLANSENENARTGLMRFDSIVLIVTEVAPTPFLSMWKSRTNSGHICGSQVGCMPVSDGCWIRRRMTGRDIQGISISA